jgi:quinoprotein glucose dehydrogenase
MPNPSGEPPAPPEWGSPNLGGPIATAGGLVFIGATLDRNFRAFDIETGQVLWSTNLPAGGKATPMTYAIRGRQFVVIAAGGGDRFGVGDHVIAFALSRD